MASKKIKLVSNSLKYAFPENSAGEIAVRLLEEGSFLHLIVSDNGIGMSKSPKILGSGFGSELIRLLTRQLDGKMTLLSQPGTKVSFEFLMQKAA